MSDASAFVASLEELIAFARSRGGACLSMEFMGSTAAHLWRCGREHEFSASPRLLIEAGYWCPSCFPSVDDPGAWDYDALAKLDPLLDRFHRCD
jgi:hypothetical protein